MNNMKKYDAFISYKVDSDIDFARQLQKKLENYGRRWYKGRNTHIYRDETNLSANPDFWQSLKDAIDHSNFCIYIASKEGSKSKWVQRELDYWLSRNGIETIIIVLLDGDIVWNDSTNSLSIKDTTALPEILSRQYNFEPKYVDFKSAWSKKHNLQNNNVYLDGIASIISTIKNVTKDLIIGEEIKRKTLLKNTILGTSLILISISMIAVFYAYRANLATKDVTQKKSELLNTQIKMIPSIEANMGVAVTAAIIAETAFSNTDDTLGDMYNYYIFSQDRLVQLGEILNEQPVNIPFIWRQNTYIKIKSGTIKRISNFPIKYFYSTAEGVLFIDPEGTATFYDVNNDASISFSMSNFDYNNPEDYYFYDLNNSQLLIIVSNQSASAGGAHGRLLILDYKKHYIDFLADSFILCFTDDCRQVDMGISKDFGDKEPARKHGPVFNLNFKNYKIESPENPEIKDPMFGCKLSRQIESAYILTQERVCASLLLKPSTIQRLNFPKEKQESSNWEIKTISNMSDTHTNIAKSKDTEESVRVLLENADYHNNINNPWTWIDNTPEALKEQLLFTFDNNIEYIFAEQKYGHTILYTNSEGAHRGIWYFCSFTKKNELKGCGQVTTIGTGDDIVLSDNNELVFIENMRYLQYTTFEVWNLKTMKNLSPHKLPHSILYDQNPDKIHKSVSFSADLKKFAVIDSDGLVWIYKSNGYSKFVYSHADSHSSDKKAESIKFTDNNRLFIGYRSGDYLLHDTDTQDMLWASTHEIISSKLSESIKNNKSFDFYLSPNRRMALISKWGQTELINVNNGAKYSGVLNIHELLESSGYIDENSIIKTTSINIGNTGNTEIAIEIVDSTAQNKQLFINRKPPANWDTKKVKRNIDKYTGYQFSGTKKELLLKLPNTSLIDPIHLEYIE